MNIQKVLQHKRFSDKHLLSFIFLSWKSLWLSCRLLSDEFTLPFKLCMSRLCDAFHRTSSTTSTIFSFPPSSMLLTNIVCYGKHIVYPANFHFSSLSHTQLTLTRMHQAQENIKRVKRKSNGLWQFECGVEGKKVSMRNKGERREQEAVECVWDFLIYVNVKNLWNFHNSICIPAGDFQSWR